MVVFIFMRTVSHASAPSTAGARGLFRRPKGEVGCAGSTVADRGTDAGVDDARARARVPMTGRARVC